MPDLNEYGVDMSTIAEGAVLRFGDGEVGRVIRMDLPRLGVVEVLESGVHTTGERAIFHSLNVVAIEETSDDNGEASPHPEAFRALYNAFRALDCDTALDPADRDDCASVADEAVRVLLAAGLLRSPNA